MYGNKVLMQKITANFGQIIMYVKFKNIITTDNTLK